ncbi:MAG TPA: DUF4129 domain-containing protein [Galbitalea sp.]|nr:DUF4129 domain-containing protein [Galbitalea sp.]
MKRAGGRVPTIVVLAGLICVLVAIGAGLQGRSTFTGPRWIPGNPAPVPPVQQTANPQSTVPATAAPHSSIAPTVVIGWVPLVIIVSLLVLAVLLLLLRFFFSNRSIGARRTLSVDAALSDSPVEVNTDADLPVLHRGLLRAADLLDTDREPRDAIVRAWIGLQEAAEDSGVSRRPSETPTEFTSRVFESVAADRKAASTLLDVYLRVRFSRKPATDSDVVVARQAIQRLRDTWPAGTPG